MVSEIRRAADHELIMKIIEDAMRELSNYERGLLEAIASALIVSDDEGEVWYWANGKIRLAVAELEAPNHIDCNGYFCESLEAGVKLLMEMEYITCLHK